jgi:hypothetical protein
MPSNSNTRARQLEALAASRFDELKEAERRVLQASPEGKVANCGPNEELDKSSTDPSRAAEWGSEREVRAELLRWLCLHDEAVKLIDPRGIQLYGAKINGILDLSHSNVTFPLRFERCCLSCDAILEYVRIPALDLTDCCMYSLHADGAEIRGDLCLRGQCSATGEVRLLGAHIGGDLICEGATFRNPNGNCLSADRIDVKGNVFINNGFSAVGSVRFSGAQIGGCFECDKGSFSNSGARALDTDSFDVAGSVFLRVVSIEGEVWLVGANIGSNLDCRGSTLKNPGGKALIADNIKVTGSVFLRNGFSADGEVWLLNAQIGSNLDCIDGIFRNATSRALTADGVNVGGGVLFRGGFAAEGEVRLRGAHIRQTVDCDGGSIRNGRDRTLNCEQLQVEGSVLFRKGFAEGEVCVLGARISGNLECDGSTFKNPGGVALNAEGIQVARSIFLHKISVEGELRLLGAKIGDSLECMDGSLNNPSSVALIGDRLDVGGTVFLNQRFSTDGEIRLTGAQIGSNFDCAGGTFKNTGKNAIFADKVNIRGHVFFRRGFSSEGDVVLFGAQIAGGLDCSEGRFSAIDLRTATVAGIFRWVCVRSINGTRLDLRNASVGSIADDETSWPTNLELDGFIYARISEGPTSASARLKWLSQLEHFTAQPYQYLATLLRNSGDDAGARQVLFQMEDRRRQEEADRMWYWRCWDWILKWTIGYGQRSEWALGWLIGLTLLGSVLFGCGYLGGAIIPSDKDDYLSFEQNGRVSSYYPTFNALAYSFEHAFPLVNLGVKDYWRPNPSEVKRAPELRSKAFQRMRDTTVRQYYVFRLCAPGFLRYWRSFQILAGWLLATLFVAGLTGMVKSSP